MYSIELLYLNYKFKFMSIEKNLDKNKKPTYEIKETPLLKKILNKILGPIRFF